MENWKNNLKYLRDKLEKEEFFKLFKLLSQPTITKIYSAKIEELTLRDNTKRIIEEVYSSLTSENRGYKKLYNIVMELLGKNSEIGYQVFLNNYIGKYIVYRKGKSDNLIKGEIEIFTEDEIFMFSHKSTQKIESRRVNFDHRGIVIYMTGRIYFFAVGNSAQGAYIRPMFVNSVDNPCNSIMYGVLLTELYGENRPFSTIVAMCHKEFAKTTGYDEIENEISSHLRNKSEVSQGCILYPPWPFFPDVES